MSAGYLYMHILVKSESSNQTVVTPSLLKYAMSPPFCLTRNKCQILEPCNWYYYWRKRRRSRQDGASAISGPIRCWSPCTFCKVAILITMCGGPGKVCLTAHARRPSWASFFWGGWHVGFLVANMFLDQRRCLYDKLLSSYDIDMLIEIHAKWNWELYATFRNKCVMPKNMGLDI